MPSMPRRARRRFRHEQGGDYAVSKAPRAFNRASQVRRDDSASSGLVPARGQQPERRKRQNDCAILKSMRGARIAQDNRCMRPVVSDHIGQFTDWRSRLGLSSHPVLPLLFAPVT